MHMKRLIINFKRKSIHVNYNGKNAESLSFENCFLTNIKKLPSPFIIRNGRVFCSVKLQINTGIVHSITYKGKFRFCDLKKMLPTIFDIKYIKKMNHKNFIQENILYIETILQGIINKEDIYKITEV